MLVTDSAGATLQGSIDGSNRDFVVSLDPDPESVLVWINGRCKEPALDDGYTLPGGRVVRLKEAPLVGDTVAVTYQLAGEASLGGAANVGSPHLSVESLSPPRVHAHVRCCSGACS